MAGELEESLTRPSLTVDRNGTLYAFFGETQVTEFGEDVKEGPCSSPCPTTPARRSPRG